MGDDQREPKTGKFKRLGIALLALVIAAGAGTAIVWSVAPERDVHSAPTKRAVQARSALSHRTIAGIVQRADGKPASNVQVSLSTFQHPSVFLLNGQINGKTVLTNSEGKFEFDTAEGPQGLIARSDAGYAAGNILNLDSPTLVLTPWGRVEGSVRRGTKPLGNSPILLSYSLAIPGQTQAFFGSNFNTNTDANGKFILDRVPEGVVRLGIASSGARRGARRTARMQELVVHSGATTSIQFGGKGRPVIGKLDPQIASDLRQIAMVPDAPDPFAGRDLSNLPGPERIMAQRELARSPEYRQWLQARQNAFTGDVEPDGTFRIDEVTAGKYTLQATFTAVTPRTNNVPAMNEQIASAKTSITIDPIPDGTTDEPFDVGTIPLTVVKRLAIGQSVPDFAVNDSSDKPVKLSDFKGRYVLLLINPTQANGFVGNTALRFAPVFDRFWSDPRLVMLVVHTGREAEKSAKESARSGVRWRTAFVTDASPLPEEYENANRGIMLIDPSRNLVSKHPDPLSAYAAVERALAANGKYNAIQFPGAIVQAERAITSVAYGGGDYVKVPAPSAEDAATNAEFSSIAGVVPQRYETIAHLNDGKMQTSPDDPQNSFFYDTGSIEGRLRIDLGKLIPIERVNSYSWHKDDRAPQVYVLYGSTGKDPKFDAAPGLGIDPSAHGWTPLGVVDTRSLGRGGRHAVSVLHNSAPLGNFRYLLFEIFLTETRDGFGNTFYGEIDVVEKK